MMILLTLNQMKSVKVSDLEFFRHLLTLETWMLLQQPLVTQTCSAYFSKALQWAIQQWGLQENLTRSPCCIDPLYILQASGLCYNNMFTSCPITHPPCFYLKATMLCPYALISYSLISVTMCTPCVYYEELMFLNIIPNPNSSLDSS